MIALFGSFVNKKIKSDPKNDSWYAEDLYNGTLTATSWQGVHTFHLLDLLLHGTSACFFTSLIKLVSDENYISYSFKSVSGIAPPVILYNIFYKFFGNWFYRELARSFKVLFDIPNTKKLTKPDKNSINSVIDFSFWTCGPLKSRGLETDIK